MITVTDSAKQYLRELLLAHIDDPDFGVRLSRGAPGQLGLVLDRGGVGDHVVEHNGSKVLLVAPELAALLDNVTIDTEDTAEGAKLVMSKE